MKLVVAATAPNQTQAELWQNLLMEEGIGATVHQGDLFLPTYIGISHKPCRVMVSEENLEAAREVLAVVSDTPPPIDPDLPDQ